MINRTPVVASGSDVNTECALQDTPKKTRQDEGRKVHLNIYLKAPFLSVLLDVANARPHC